MAKKHKKTDFDRARDELMSLVHRCNVLDAEESQQNDWLRETVEYMSERYPSLAKMELAQLEIVGRQFCQPVIRHGAENTALSREEEPASPPVSPTAASEVVPVA